MEGITKERTMKKQIAKELTDIRNDLYESLPTGKFDEKTAFDLISKISIHLTKLDSLINILEQ